MYSSARVDARPACALAAVTKAAGARSHIPKHGLRIHVVVPPAAGVPAGPNAVSSASMISFAPPPMHAMSSQTCTTSGGRGFVENIS